MNRRGFIAGIGALLAAPAIIRTPGLLMPVKRLIVPAAGLALSDIVQAALRNKSGHLADMLSRNNALLARLRGEAHDDIVRDLRIDRAPLPYWHRTRI